MQPNRKQMLLEQLQQVLMILNQSYPDQSIIVAGDMNMNPCDWEKWNKNINMQTPELHTEHFTREDKAGLSSCLDHFSARNFRIKDVKAIHDHEFKSDHHMVVCRSRFGAISKAQRRQRIKVILPKPLSP